MGNVGGKSRVLSLYMSATWFQLTARTVKMTLRIRNKTDMFYLRIMKSEYGALIQQTLMVPELKKIRTMGCIRLWNNIRPREYSISIEIVQLEFIALCTGRLVIEPVLLTS